MEDTVSGKGGRNGLFAFFKGNPWIGIVGSLASIVAIPLAVFFYFQSVRVSELVYCINPARAIVVNHGAASRLAVSFDGRPVTQDVTAVQLAIWNRGRQAIRPTAVLQPIVIKTEPSVPILEASIRKKSREVVHFDLDHANRAGGQLTLSWNILEEGDGTVLQIVYAGGTSTKIQCLGVLEGEPAIRELTYPGRTESSEEQPVKTTELILMAVVLLAALFVVKVGAQLFKVIARQSRSKLWLLVPYLPIMLFLVLAILKVFQWRAFPNPPFGFE